MVVNGSLSKTAVNGSAGAKSQLSGLVVAALTVVTLLFLTGLFEELPEATLAAVVIAAVDRARRHRRARRALPPEYARARPHLRLAARPDFIAAIAAMLGVLVFDTLPGLFIGIGVVAAAAALPRVAPARRRPRSRPGTTGQFGDVDRQPDNERRPGRRRSCASRAGCSSPTPTPSARPSVRRGRATRGRSCSMPRACPGST